MPMSSPWGEVQHKTTIMRGIHFVSTAGHGGFMVSKGMMKQFSPALALASVYGGTYGGYICFEEDCEAAAVLLELHEKGMTIPEGWTVNPEQIKESFKHYPGYAQYCAAKGILTNV